jgi:hypothetical protein
MKLDDLIKRAEQLLSKADNYGQRHRPVVKTSSARPICWSVQGNRSD